MGKQKPKQLVAAIYCRTSGDDADLAKQDKKTRDAPGAKVRQSESIAEQELMCQARCEKMGFKEAGIFKDPNLSGRTYPKGFEIPDGAFDDYFLAHIKRQSKRVRPALGDLLSLPHIDVIVVRDVYRLLRPAFRSHLGNHLWQILAKRNITIHSVNDGDIDSNKFEDLMMTNLKLAIADQAKRQEVEASIRSLRAKKDDGYLASGVKCFGFRSRIGAPQKVDPVPAELKIVRLIYDQYLAGGKMLEIVKGLNDDRKVTTITGSRWTVYTIRNLLIRPYYCGLTYNTQGDLIPSKVFPTGKKATVTEDEFYQVLRTFEGRKRFEVRTDADQARQRKQEQDSKPTRGGSKMGIRQARGIVHPLSGLVKCGCCGRNLYITTLINQYYADAVEFPVTTYHYICKTPQFTKSKEFTECGQVRIMEHYPEKVLEVGTIKPAGYGLIEALFPVLFHGYIHKYIQQTTVAPALNAERDQLRYQLETILANEERLFTQQEDGTIDPGQFAMGMKRSRERRQDLQTKLDKVDADISELAVGGAAVPKEQFQNPALIPRETIQELAHATFKEIVVYPMKIRVVLKAPDAKTGQEHWFEIDRIKRRNSRVLPFWSARISTESITAETKIGVAYFYNGTSLGNYGPVGVMFQDRQLEVITLGSNESVDKKRNKDLQPPGYSDKSLQDWFGPPPAYQRKLTVGSKVFFSQAEGEILRVKEPTFMGDNEK